ncbi:phage major capsid protein [Paracidovorax wautersii]|uniref:HK97 family phage major capsid protein n=1 Tax=Paracidovorax wautersii TaxID=1177982 RepID=A0ABU1IG27_9BURK|nr:phage major capsid protein [Paracidovorax wautersii]MDR6216180.1 HK97 family phage major capsid protein [Paracidovorax wautersii]
MKLTRSHFAWTIVAVAALACLFALTGHPVANYLPPDVMAALGAAGAMPFMTGETRSLQDQIKRLQDTRTAKALEMEGVQNKALNEGRTKDESEREAFKGLSADIAQIDAELEDLRALEALQVTKAVPATGAGSAAGAAPGAVARGALATGAGPAIHVNKDADEKFKGQNYTRIVIAKALSRLADGDVSPLAIAEARWGKTNPTLINVMKAAVPGGGTGAGEWGAELAAIDQRYTGDFIEYLYSQTVYDKLALRQVPANVQIKGQDGAATAYWVGQSKAIPATTADFMNVTLTPLKVAALAVVSNELLRDSSPAAEQLVRDALVEASSQRVDTTFLSAAAGVAGVSPAGILNGLTGITSAGTDGAGLRADIKALYAPFIAAKNVNGLQLVTTPSLAKSIQLMTNALGLAEFPTINASGGTLLGDTVTTGDNVGAGQMIMLKPSDIYRIGDSGVQVSISREAMIEQDTAPTGATDTPTGASANYTSMFQSESTAIKVVRSINFAKRRASAVAFVTGADYGAPETP